MKRRSAPTWKSTFPGVVKIEVWGPECATCLTDWFRTSIYIFRWVKCTKNPRGWNKDYRLRARDVRDLASAWKEFQEWFSKWSSTSPVRWNIEFVCNPPRGIAAPDGWEKPFSHAAGNVMFEVIEPSAHRVTQDTYHTFIHIYRWEQHDKNPELWKCDTRLLAVDVENFNKCWEEFKPWFKKDQRRYVSKC